MAKEFENFTKVAKFCQIRSNWSGDVIRVVAIWNYCGHALSRFIEFVTTTFG